MTSDEAPLERGLLSMSEESWQEARRRAAVVGPLAALESVTHRAADSAGQQLRLPRRQVDVLVKRHWQGSGLVTDLAPGRSSGGRCVGPLRELFESAIQDAIRAEYLHRQKLNLAAVHCEVVRKCKAQGCQRLPAALWRAGSLGCRRRSARASPGKLRPARSFRAAPGISPSVLEPLQQVQIDHTVVDVMVVDERDRQPIGRPGLRGERDLVVGEVGFAGVFGGVDAVVRHGCSSFSARSSLFCASRSRTMPAMTPGCSL